MFKKIYIDIVDLGGKEFVFSFKKLNMVAKNCFSIHFKYILNYINVALSNKLPPLKMV